jgi:hypothetical protein
MLRPYRNSKKEKIFPIALLSGGYMKDKKLPRFKHMAVIRCISKLGSRWKMNALWVLTILLAQSTMGYASVISYSSSALGGERWRYAYTVQVLPGESAIDEFTVYFDTSQYRNLLVEGSPPNWDSIVLQPDLSIPSDGMFDSLALDTGIEPGHVLGNFFVSFDFSGSGTPGAQRYEVVDPVTFAVIRSGLTDAGEPPPGPSELPEPGTLTLVLAGAFAFLVRRYR